MTLTGKFIESLTLIACQMEPTGLPAPLHRQKRNGVPPLLYKMTGMAMADTLQQTPLD
jgi:hypothetical protein